jgi:uncharacterized membrane protein (DUF485 family)
MSAPTGHQATERPPGAAPAAASADDAIDWRHLASTPEFAALHSSRRRFTLAGMAIETGALLLVMGLYGFAPDAMGKPAIGSITWALVSGAGLVLLTFVMAWAYARKAREWEEMSARALEHAERAEPAGRFAR